jgi:hypothetical protein
MQRVRTHFEAAIEAERGAGTMEREQREREREQRERERERSSLDLAAAQRRLVGIAACSEPPPSAGSKQGGQHKQADQGSQFHGRVRKVIARILTRRLMTP